MLSMFIVEVAIDALTSASSFMARFAVSTSDLNSPPSTALLVSSATATIDSGAFLISIALVKNSAIIVQSSSADHRAYSVDSNNGMTRPSSKTLANGSTFSKSVNSS